MPGTCVRLRGTPPTGRPRWRLSWACLLLAGVCGATRGIFAAPSDGELFFEQKIRPVLVQHCYSCHSAEAAKQGKLQAGLLVDSAGGLRTGGESGPAIVPQKPAASLLIKALRYETYEMPPSGKLPAEVIADFEKWIAAGAPDPRQDGQAPAPRRSAFEITPTDRQHWSFQPVREPSPTDVPSSWDARGPLDGHVYAPLLADRFPVPDVVDKPQLLRRVTVALTGLPPTPAEVASFLADDRPDAYHRVVDRLLASPRFGVHAARSWLDGVRYATDVDQSGAYRDWVVGAFNADLPYDRFLQLQFAGDLLPGQPDEAEHLLTNGSTPEGVTATGMLALAIWEQVGLDLAVAELVDSQMDVLGRHVLGLTLSCARCHDHKFDPISTEDYYGLAGVFFSSHVATGKIIADGRLANEVLNIPLLSARDAALNSQIEQRVAEIDQRIADLTAMLPHGPRLRSLAKEQSVLEGQLAKATGDSRKGLSDKVQALQVEAERLQAEAAKQQSALTQAAQTEISSLEKLATQWRGKLVTAPQVIGIREGGVPGSVREKIGDVPVYLRGEVRITGKVIPRRVPTIFGGTQATSLGQPAGQSGRRELASWLSSPENPLTSRVAANRLWQGMTGQAIVRSPDNFGRLGDPPTHPELLDYLAHRFVARGWSTKGLLREIALSRVFRHSGSAPSDQLTSDPDNRRLARAQRRRLTYEEFRDSLLMLAGQLDESSAAVGGTRRRTLYQPLERKKLQPTAVLFDGPDPKAIVPARPETTTAPQALYWLNDPQVHDAAEHITAQVSGTDPWAAERLWLLIYGRPPADRERQLASRFLIRGTWPQLVQILLSSNEFAYLD